MSTIRIIYCAGIILFAFACKKENCFEGKRTFELLPNSEITITTDTTHPALITFVDIHEGNFIVAKYQYERDCEYANDDEYAERLAFHIDKDLESFIFKDEEINSINFFYQEWGAWITHQKYALKSGIISGKKIESNRWDIQINIELAGLDSLTKSKNIVLDGIFRS